MESMKAKVSINGLKVIDTLATGRKASATEVFGDIILLYVLPSLNSCWFVGISLWCQGRRLQRRIF